MCPTQFYMKNSNCDLVYKALLLCGFRKDCGLDKFVSPALLETMKGKDLRKLISHHMKMNQGLSAPGQKQLTALQAKLHYMKIVSELRTFGGKCFMATLVVSTVEMQE